jgi:uncharacterized membrane protein (DUF4010 family)
MMLPMLGSGLLLGLVPLWRRRRAATALPEFNAPEASNPTNLRVALGFGIIYALILVASAWLSDRAGSDGLYALAVTLVDKRGMVRLFRTPMENETAASRLARSAPHAGDLCRNTRPGH